MGEVIQIGRCMGCELPARLDEGVCQRCLRDPSRGRCWAETARRIRTEPAFACKVFLKLGSGSARSEFLRFFGEHVLSPSRPRPCVDDVGPLAEVRPFRCPPATPR